MPTVLQILPQHFVMLLTMGLFFIAGISVMRCNSYGLAEKLENPGGLSDHQGQVPFKGRIFMSQTSTAGNLGGISGADSICNTDPGRPADNSAYKALLVDGSTRNACSTANCSGGISENVNWVLKPNTAYHRLDGVTIIAQTNGSAIWPAPISFSNAIDSTATPVWTGITMAGGSEWMANAVNPCASGSSWTSTAGTIGTTGQANGTDITAIYATTQTCNFAKNLYCVEQ